MAQEKLLRKAERQTRVLLLASQTVITLPANNAMQGLRRPCKDSPFSYCTDFAGGTAVGPHGLAT